jgi:23S rRNA (uracil1939-C5)-methyltransferase
MTDDMLTLRVEKLSSHGEGIAFSEGKAVFIPYSIPGELAICKLIEEHASFSRAELVEIEELSLHRVAPPCSLFGVCGGCTLQHIEYRYQTILKRDAARETFLRIGGFDPGKLEIVVGDPYHYRNRIQIHMCDDGGLGFTKAGSHETVRAVQCPILAPVLERWLVVENRKARPYRALSALIGERPRFVAFGQDEHIYIEGRDAHAGASVLSKRFQFPVAHFFQSNITLMEKLIERCIEPLKGEHALDLYSGAGLFSLFLADNFDSIECVENSTASMEAARLNLSRVSAKVSFSDTLVERWIKTPHANRAFDCIVADPPRTGMSPKVRAWLTDAQADLLLYVSCDHASLARDLQELTQKGWTVENITLFDFYPQTGRLEAVARLARVTR